MENHLALNTIEFISGAIIALVALTDVFASVLVLGASKRRFAVGRRVVRLTLPAWRHASRRGSGVGRHRLPNILAPILFGLTFTSWLLLLLIGFGLMFHASSDSFSPPLTDVSQAI